jgi:hypothetical protein
MAYQAEPNEKPRWENDGYQAVKTMSNMAFTSEKEKFPSNRELNQEKRTRKLSK